LLINIIQTSFTPINILLRLVE